MNSIVAAIAGPSFDGPPTWAAVAAGVLIGVYALLVGGLVLAGRHADARAVAGFVPDCAILFKRLLAADELPLARKLALLLLLGYLVSPIDLIPDFIPALGQLDDAVVVVLILRYALRGTDPEHLRRLWPGPDSSIDAVIAAAFGRGR